MKIYFHYALIVLFFLCILFYQISNKPIHQQILPQQAYRYTVLLVPLDSRPACLEFVTDLASIANIKVITPPKELLDLYKTPADVSAVRSWFQENIKEADAAIISIDMLIHGGLMASRLPNGNEKDIADTLALLTQTHQLYPKIPIYAFNILPRLWIADNEKNKEYQKAILKYSKLKDQVSTFENPADIKELKELEEEIPLEIRNKYLSLYKENAGLNRKLIDMANNGIFENFIIGQDDGQIFGIPNMYKHQLEYYLDRINADESKIFITRGTDEIALSMLGNIVMRLEQYKPKIYVEYNDANAPGLIMPYMPHSVETTVQEKIHILSGTEVFTPDEADIILYIYIGTEQNLNQRYETAMRIQTLLSQNDNIALIDLSEDFEASQTIFPLLVDNQMPINQLIAYSGWNTASNSIGTAVTQASIFTAMKDKAPDTASLLNLYYHNLRYLSARFLEDWYYLKDAHTEINQILKQKKIDVYHLAEHENAANILLQNKMADRARILSNKTAYQMPIMIHTPEGDKEITLQNVTVRTTFPWPRTFEIWLEPEISLFLKNNEKSY